ncbi:MAG: AsmA family protein [Methylocystaceae bacterium]|nr:AsmA family protein [Methylocystaceae bacterium]
MIFLVILLGLIATPFLLPSSVYQNLLEQQLDKSTGLDFQFKGEFSFSLFPTVILEAENVDFYGTMIGEVETLGSIEKISLELDGLDFLTGDIHVDDFLLYNPRMTINGDFTPHLPDVIRTNLSAARKEDIRYLEVLLHFMEDSVFEKAKLNEGTLQWNKGEDKVITIQKLEVNLEKPSGGKDFTLESNLYINNRSVDLNMRLQRPDDFLRGFRSDLAFQLDSAPLKVDFQGNAARRQSFVAQGDVRLDIPSVYDYCTWFNKREFCEEKSENVLIKSHVKLRDQRLQLEDLLYTHNPSQFSANVAVDFKYALPLITGDLIVPAQTVQANAPSFEKIKKINFENFLFDTFDADVNVKYLGLQLANGETISPNVNLNVNDGRLTVTSDRLNILGGISNVRFRWNKGMDNGVMDLRMDVRAVSIKELQKATGMDLQTNGALNFFFEIQSQGHNLMQFLKTSKVHGEFSILDGHFKQPDVIQSLNGQNLGMFEFAEIKGHFKGERGEVTSDDIKFVAPFVDVEGLANLNMLDRTLTVQLTSTIPPTDGKAAHKGYVHIVGPINQLMMRTSANNDKPIIQEKGLHSGLIPNNEKLAEPAIDGDLVVEETDLLD